jgi:hypothetical protein
MPSPTDRFEVDRESASKLKRLVLEELSDEIMLDERALDSLVRGIVSLLRGERLDRSSGAVNGRSRAAEAP